MQALQLLPRLDCSAHTKSVLSVGVESGLKAHVLNGESAHSTASIGCSSFSDFLICLCLVRSRSVSGGRPDVLRSWMVLSLWMGDTLGAQSPQPRPRAEGHTFLEPVKHPCVARWPRCARHFVVMQGGAVRRELVSSPPNFPSVLGWSTVDNNLWLT